ncbi:MAG: prolipoprotein diacylglyceryl transferase, partial [Chloroflexota bacterium]|nr:prolipoprotein diacylglyceryl transferase [Chloroflexota bacterium]
HLGTPSTLPWSVTYTHPDTLGERGLSVHPAVAYEMLWNLAAFGFLLWLLPRVRVRGIIFWLFLILYSVGRIWTHEFRKDPTVAFGLQEAQLISVLVLAVSIPALVYVWRRGSASQPQVAGATDDVTVPSGPQPAR